jgi:hypothetical protein
MADKGFKRKLAAIITNAKLCSRLMPDPEELMSHKLAHYSISKTGIALQYWFPGLYRATEGNDRKYLINFPLNPYQRKERNHGKTNHQL